METNRQFLKDAGAAIGDLFITKEEKEARRTIFTVSAVAFDFDFVTSDPSKSRADEIRVLLVKNKKPSRKSKEGKPGGFGLPTGQLESKENMIKALERETRDESGCLVRKVIGKLLMINKRLMINGDPIPNEIHIFLVEASEPLSRIREVDEIDGSVDPWMTLQQVFKMPLAQDKGGTNKNPNGIYFTHRQRLYDSIESMVFHPEDLIEGETIKQWIKPNRKYLKDAMADLDRDGLLNDYSS